MTFIPLTSSPTLRAVSVLAEDLVTSNRAPGLPNVVSTTRMRSENLERTTSSLRSLVESVVEEVDVCTGNAEVDWLGTGSERSVEAMVLHHGS